MKNISHTNKGISENEWWNIRKKQLKYRTDDISFILNQLSRLNDGKIKSQFKNKLNLDKIGIFGHSYGGATSILSSIYDDRIDVCLTYDAWFLPIPDSVINAGFNKPLLHIGQVKWDDSKNYIKRDSLLENCSNSKFSLDINEAKHFDFTDIPHYAPLTQRFNFSGNIQKKELRYILNDITLHYFNSYLKNSSYFDPDLISKKYNSLNVIYNVK